MDSLKSKSKNKKRIGSPKLIEVDGMWVSEDKAEFVQEFKDLKI